jgi:UDP-N-acetylglucosamine--N-acetylmuramyl-(pentapeptide) pyrophosphoryl-undecaprenol N-acetylglucosamine transferase
MKKPFIFFTGGGTAGHVFPNLPLIRKFEEFYTPLYIGSRGGMEAGIVRGWGIPYQEISSGKLRRYFSFKNFLDIFKVVHGIIQSLYFILKYKPVFIFSKGGFVSVPLGVASFLTRTPFYLHEADRSIGLANKIGALFAQKVFLSFDEGGDDKKYLYTGLPLRADFFKKETEKTFEEICDISKDKPVLLVTGGSSGAASLNKLVWENLESLAEKFLVVHLTGKGKMNEEKKHPFYIQKEFEGEGMIDLMKYADVIVSRAGAGTLFEILSLAKPALFIPLPLSQSRGDQIENVTFFKDKKVFDVLYEEDIPTADFVSRVQTLLKEKENYEKRIKALELPDATSLIYSHIHHKK